MSAILSVVSPLYRNGEVVAEFIRRLHRTLASSAVAGWSVVLVDDHCPEASGQLAVDTWPGPASALRVLRLDHNVGQHAAAWKGLEEATGDVVCILDADLQDRPEDLPALLAMLRPGVDVVAAGRRGRYTSTGRMLTALAFRGTRTVLTNGRIPVDAGMFLVANRGVVERLLELDDPGIHILTGFVRVGASIVTVPVPRMSRNRGASAYTNTRRLALALAALADCTPAYVVDRRLRRRHRQPVLIDDLAATSTLDGSVEPGR